jgi:hypothetical protein
MKAGDGHRDAFARASRVDHAVRRHQRVDSRLENARHLTSVGCQRWPSFTDADNRVKAEPADGNIERRQCSQDADEIRRQPHFLAGFPERGLFERFAGIDDAARQRNLAAVTAERIGADRQENVRVRLSIYSRREDQQQTRRMTQLLLSEAVGPLSARDGCQVRLRCRTRQLACERIFESCDDIRKLHLRRAARRYGTTVMAEQLFCGAGYDADVIALTTSEAMYA